MGLDGGETHTQRPAGGIMGLLRCWDAIIVTWMEVIHEMDGSETSDGVETEHG